MSRFALLVSASTMAVVAGSANAEAAYYLGAGLEASRSDVDTVRPSFFGPPTNTSTKFSDRRVSGFVGVRFTFPSNVFVGGELEVFETLSSGAALDGGGRTRLMLGFDFGKTVVHAGVGRGIYDIEGSVDGHVWGDHALIGFSQELNDRVSLRFDLMQDNFDYSSDDGSKVSSNASSTRSLRVSTIYTF